MSSCPSACLHASFWLFAAASISITTGGAAFGLPPEEVSLRATPDQAASRTAATEPRLGKALGPALLGAFDARAGPGARGMAQSQLTLSLPFADAGAFVFGGEIMGRFGLVPVEGGTALVGLAGGIRVGHSPRADLDVGLSLRIAHIHDAPHGAWVDHTSDPHRRPFVGARPHHGGRRGPRARLGGPRSRRAPSPHRRGRAPRSYRRPPGVRTPVRLADRAHRPRLGAQSRGAPPESPRYFDGGPVRVAQARSCPRAQALRKYSMAFWKSFSTPSPSRHTSPRLLHAIALSASHARP